MIRRAVIRAPARGYVDGKYIGEEKEPKDADDGGSVLGKRRGKPSDGRRRKAGAVVDGNTTRSPRRSRASLQGVPQGERRPRPAGGAAGAGGAANTGRGKKRGPPRGGGEGRGNQANNAGNAGNLLVGNTLGQAPAPRGSRGADRGTRPTPRKARAGKKTPFRAPVQKALISEVAENRRLGEEAKSGQFADALAASQNVKRERLHKVLAQSGHGSRRDMEILIASGRLMVNGIVATAGTQVAQGDNVLLDHRPIKLKFTEDLPRILLYHKPEGEIVTTNDPGNRITVFDNLPKVENGKWTAIGRLDINTSGLLIFTTNGELANRFMHPRYEVEREYAVRVLGTLTDEQQQRLLAGVNIESDDEEADEASEPAPLARFDTIEKRGGEGANQWYQVTIKEGRNREVRKMFEAVGLTVSRLIRTRFGIISLPPRLLRGKMMELAPAQVLGVMSAVGLKADGTGAPPPSRRNARGGEAATAGVIDGGRQKRHGVTEPVFSDEQPRMPIMEDQPDLDGNRIPVADEHDDMIGNLVPEGNVANLATGDLIADSLTARAEQDRRNPRRNRRGMLGRGERRAGRERRRENDTQPPAFEPITDEAFRALRAEADGNRVVVAPRGTPRTLSRDPSNQQRQATHTPRPPRSARSEDQGVLGKGRRTFRRRRSGGKKPPIAGGTGSV